VYGWDESSSVERHAVGASHVAERTSNALVIATPIGALAPRQKK